MSTFSVSIDDDDDDESVLHGRGENPSHARMHVASPGNLASSWQPSHVPSRFRVSLSLSKSLTMDLLRSYRFPPTSLKFPMGVVREGGKDLCATLMGRRLKNGQLPLALFGAGESWSWPPSTNIPLPGSIIDAWHSTTFYSRA